MEHVTRVATADSVDVDELAGLAARTFPLACPPSVTADNIAALMDAVLTAARGLGGSYVWLGVNQKNQRAQRFYAKHGFRQTGTRTFQVGTDLEHDCVMVRAL